MAKERITIGIVATSSRVAPDLKERLEPLVARLMPRSTPILRFHETMFAPHGHFAGTDQARSEAFLQMANDESVDAIWFARGGYGACRLDETLFSRMTAAARKKIYLGYSDIGFVLARLYREGIGLAAHGPVPSDLYHAGGEAAVARALRFLTARDPETLEPSVHGGEPTVAFNMSILSHLLGTGWQPDLGGHVLMLEEVAEYHYAIDRSLFTILSHPAVRTVKGVRLGACTSIPQNDHPFGQEPEEMVRMWCDRAGIAYLGPAEIGHHGENRIVPFGGLARLAPLA